MVKISVLNNADEYSNLLNIESFTGHPAAVNSKIKNSDSKKDYSCRDSQVRPLRYKTELSDRKLKKQIFKIFNLIDKEKKGKININDQEISAEQLFIIVKKHNLMKPIKKAFEYMTHDLEHVKLDQVRNYLKIEKKMSDEILDKVVPKSNLEKEVTFYKFFSIVIRSSFEFINK